MTRDPIPRPTAGEYASFYAGYVALVGNRDVRPLLAKQPSILHAVCAGLSDEESLYRYAPGKWSIKEILGHLADSERVLSYRALRISRADATELSGFDENAYVENARFDRLPLSTLLAGFDAVRAATLSWLETVEPVPGMWERRVVANNNEVSLRALVSIIAGHTDHHLRILGERYGLEVPATEAAD